LPDAHAPTTEWPTDQYWQRLCAAIGRLAEQVDEHGHDDLTFILDFIENLAEARRG
jgi:hypothetical protein